MTTIKPFTDLEQSKKLAEILPIESADMYWLNRHIDLTETKYEVFVVDKSNKYVDFFKSYAVAINNNEIIPCWSLAALIEQLPYEVCDDDGNSSYLQISKEDDVYQLEYTDPYGNFESIETDRYEHFVDACYEMVIRLNELNLL